MAVDFSESKSRSEGHNMAGTRVGIICARWNSVITERLLQGTYEQLAKRGVNEDDIDLHWVPGAFEIPLVVQTAAKSGRYDAIVALGCVIRGDTAHFEYVAGPASYGILQSQLDTGVPVGFGVLTVENRRQALIRSVIDGDLDGDNKGVEAVDTVLDTLVVLRELEAEA